VNPTIRSLSVLACLAMLPSLTGCAYGTISRVYATSGSDISLTEVRAAGEASAVCEYQKEAYLLIEVATEAASVVEGVVREQTGMDAREEKPPPPCIAFEIHERVWFDAAESINLQELLREEYGTGHSFRNVSLRIKIDVLDLALNIFTLGIANSRSLEVSGDLHPRTR
jgi:hypothetical protein